MSKGTDTNFNPITIIGFFTVMLILTLDAANGKDILDVLVPYIESLTHVNLSVK